MLIDIEFISSVPEKHYHIGYTETGRQNFAFFIWLWTLKPEDRLGILAGDFEIKTGEKILLLNCGLHKKSNSMILCGP